MLSQVQEDIIVEDSLSNALEENRRMKIMVKDKFSKNPMLKQIFDEEEEDRKFEEMIDK